MRNEFAKATQREAIKRADGKCEAIGAIYGLPANQRCEALLRYYGVRFDHIDPDANSKDNSLENCCACCPRCHDWKTAKRDIPMIAKTVRQQDKNNGVTGRKHQWAKRRFGS